jgi:hypothetical protein
MNEFISLNIFIEICIVNQCLKALSFGDLFDRNDINGKNFMKII